MGGSGQAQWGITPPMMKNYRYWPWLSFNLILFMVMSTGAAAVAAGKPAIQVLVVTGGHGFDREPFFDVFRSDPEIHFTHAEHARTNATVYDRDDLLTFQAVVLYDMPQFITERQKTNFLSLFKHGIGLVVLHHALVSYQNWPDYERIIGGRYQEPDPKKPGTVTEKAGWQHDVELPITIVAKDHPVTAGLKDFVIRDEIYWGFRVSPEVTPLLSTTHPKSGKPIAWSRMEDKSRVVYLQLGHGPSAFQDSNYRQLIAQSVRWVSTLPKRN